MLVFNIVWKNELTKSLFFTICFIIVLWINMPCFVSLSSLERVNKKYRLISTDNQFLVSTILNRCKKVYKKKDVL